MPNPFAPKRRSAATPARPAPSRAAVPSRAELDDLRKADLQELARERGLDDSGTKADLVERLAG